MRRKRTRDERTHLILLVDEQEDMLLSTRRLLEGERHRVLTAASGEHALELMKAEQADLLLVSDMLPGMTVEQFVRAVRAFDPFVQIILRTESSGRKPSPGTMNELDIQGCHDKADGPERLLVWVAAGLRVQQMLSRARECEQQITQRGGDACLRVLLIAPADRDTDATDTLLATHGFQVIRAANPGAAMDAFTRRQPGFAVLDDAFFDQSGTDLVRRIQALDPAVTIIGQCAGLDARQRRAVRRSMGLYALHDKDDQAERLLELLDAAGDSARRQQRTRADSSLRGVILAKLCHDLRSYVHVVHGYVDILSQDEAATRFEPLLSRLASASSAASELVREYLDLAHLEQRAPSMQRELVDVDELVGELQMQAERQIGNRPLRFVVTMGARGAVVLIDLEKTRAVLAHLLTTVIKLSGGGTLELAVAFAATRTTFVFRDLAPHSTDDVSRLFAAVASGDDGAPFGTPGQGLALTIALRLSQLLGADLSATRSPQGGAVLTFSLPVGALGAAVPLADAVVH